MALPGDETGSSHSGEQQVVPIAELRSTISQMLREVLKEHDDKSTRDGDKSTRDGDNRKGRVARLVSRST